MKTDQLVLLVEIRCQKLWKLPIKSSIMCCVMKAFYMVHLLKSVSETPLKVSLNEVDEKVIYLPCGVEV